MFLSFLLLLLVVSEHNPPAASSIPLIAAFLLGNMVLMALAMLCSVLVCCVHDLPGDKPAPRILDRVSGPHPSATPRAPAHVWGCNPTAIIYGNAV